MNSQALALALSQIQATIGITVRFSARTWQMQVGRRWVTVLPDTAQICNDIYADCLAQVQAAQAARKAVSRGNSGPGGTKGGPAGSAGRNGVSPRLRISKHPGLSLGVPGVRLRLGARPGVMLSPNAADGPVGTAMVYGATVVGVVAGITAALYKASQAAIKYSRDVADLRVQTGGSLSTASNAIQAGRTFGIPLSGLSTENRLIQSRLSMGYGGSGSGDLDDIIAFRRYTRGQMARGPVGELFAQRMAARTNRTGYLDVAYMPDAEFASQVSRSRKLQRALGQSPADLENNAYRMNNIRNTIDQGLALLADRFGAAFTRKFGPVLDKGLDLLVDHSGEVGTMIDKGMQAAWDAGVKFAHWLYVGLPRVFHEGAIAVGEFLMNLGTGLEALQRDYNAFRNGPIGRLLMGAPNTNYGGGPNDAGGNGSVPSSGIPAAPSTAPRAPATGPSRPGGRRPAHMGLDPFGVDEWLNPFLANGIENLKEGARYTFLHPFTKFGDYQAQRSTEINLSRQANMAPGSVRARYLRGEGPAPRWINPNAQMDANGAMSSEPFSAAPESHGALYNWGRSAAMWGRAGLKDDNDNREKNWQQLLAGIGSIAQNTKDTARGLRNGSGLSVDQVRAQVLADIAEDSSLSFSR